MSHESFVLSVLSAFNIELEISTYVIFFKTYSEYISKTWLIVGMSFDSEQQ